MIDYIKFDGREYPVCMGFAALRECERERGQSLVKVIGNIDNSFSDAVYVCYLALKHGQRRANEPVTLTEEIVADLLDEPGKLTELSDLIGEQLGKILALPQPRGVVKKSV
jgi:hypothetical protein